MNDHDLGIEIHDGDAEGIHICSRCRSCKQWNPVRSEHPIRWHVCEHCAPTIQEAIDLAAALDSLKKL